MPAVAEVAVDFLQLGVSSRVSTPPITGAFHSLPSTLDAPKSLVFECPPAARLR